MIYFVLLYVLKNIALDQNYDKTYCQVCMPQKRFLSLSQKQKQKKQSKSLARV